MKEDIEYIPRCYDKSQRFGSITHQPGKNLHSSIPSWSFMRWGLDVVGKLPNAMWKKEYIITATDFFTKWVKAEPLSRI